MDQILVSFVKLTGDEDEGSKEKRKVIGESSR